MKMKNRDFISLKDFTRSELEGLLDLALEMKAGRNKQQYLTGKSIGMLFTVASTRTRISFQVAAHQLGAHAEHYKNTDLQLSNHETLVDTAEVMSRLLDAIIVRMYDMSCYGKGRESLNLMAEHSKVPVINALDDKDHPCQVMGDILTLKEKFGGNYKKKKIVLAWAYAKRQKSPGVLHSMLTAASLLGMNVTFAHPQGFELDEEYVCFARKKATESGASIGFSNDLDEACDGADAIYAKSYMGLKMSKEEDERHRYEFRNSWRISEQHFKRANSGAYFMDCMPLIRGDEATADVVDGKNSIRYDQAENRLHIQKAILASIL